MDFAFAEKRLQREQSKIRSRQRPSTSAKAQREAEYRKKEQAEVRRKREEKAAQRQYALKYYNDCNRAMKVQQLAAGDGLVLRATSIHGDGDKIALPTSVLERLTTTMDQEGGGGSSPWTFRVGILHPKYEFPSSPSLQSMKPPNEDDEYESDDNDDDNTPQAAYLDELSYKYIAYSHGTVVEFTQEEGHIGLPTLIASALLKPNHRLNGTDGSANIHSIRTKDPAVLNDDNASDLDVTMGDRNGEKTPGHLAYDAFDIPGVLLKVEMITLPKAKACTLVPSMDAIRSGFFNLKNVKLVMEQSLIRTRATLSVGDTVTTWHRGVVFSLTVASVTPADFAAVSCINTDMEVEIGANVEYEAQQQQQPQEIKPESDASLNRGKILGGNGYKLSETNNVKAESRTTPAAVVEENTTAVLLKPEPPADQKENICTIQIRGDRGSGRRRFDIQESTIEDIFAFARTMSSAHIFQLVTRFPRSVISESNKLVATLFAQGSQEVLMVEKL